MPSETNPNTLIEILRKYHTEDNGNEDVKTKFEKSNPSFSTSNQNIIDTQTNAKPEVTSDKSEVTFTGFQSPIKSDWKSSGGFTGVPSPSHPKGHDGVDMRAPIGTPVYPLTEGIVANVGPDPSGGNTINIDHPNKITSYYAHLSTIKVHKGDKVDKNTVIGTVGKSGNAKNTWPHLHFGVRETGTKGSWKDPSAYFTVPKYVDLTPEEKSKGMYASEEARLADQSFNIQQHVSSQPAQPLSYAVSFIDQKYKYATNYFLSLKHKW